MNSLRLALTALFFSAISPVFGGAPELEPAPSPTEEEKNSTEIFDYETTYTGNSDYKDYRGKFGDGDSLNSNPIAAPGGGLIWLFTDHLRLEGVFPKPALVYNPNDDWEFRIAGNLYYESFRTDNVYTPAAKLVVHDPVVQYSEDRAGLQATYSHFKPFDITLDVGCTFRRDFDFFRAEAAVKTDPAPYIRFAVEAKF